jgi:DNA-binding MurR/RpiR family transcriptional regulator
MNILLSRILTYLNGTLFLDHHYRICMFIVFHYLEMDNMSEEEFLKKGNFKKEELYSFIALLGYNQYEEFRQVLVSNHETRCNQIRVRMIGASSDDLIHNMEKACSDEEMREQISNICEHLFKSKRIVVIGALYPISIAIELQTDMITFGKPFIQFHNYDPIVMNEDDVAIVISATGRALEGFKRAHKDVHIERAKQILITQNKKYLKTETTENCHVLYVPGKFDSINFNYQLMTVFDLIRIHYYQQYYL